MTAAAQVAHDKLGIRESEDGVVLRVYESMVQGSPNATDVVGSPIPATCFPDFQIEVQASTRRIAQVAWFSGRSDEPFPAQGQILGIPERAPVGVVLARLPEGAASATMRFANGVTDSAEALDGGWVALAAHVPGTSERDLGVGAMGRVSYLDGDGEQVASKEVFVGYGMDGSAPECSPGSPRQLIEPLPEATGPSPTDTGAARAAVRAAYKTVFDGETDVTVEARMAALEGGESLRSSFERAAAAYPDVGATSAHLGKVKFLNDHEAALRFHIKQANGDPLSPTLIGRAVLVDGTWRVATSTWCELLVDGGTACP